MFNKILIGSDGSEDARNAALLGAEIARRFGSEVLALNVADLSFQTTGELGAWAVQLSPSVIDICAKTQLAAAERIIKPIFEPLARPYQMLQEIDHPVDGIVKAAQREQVDLIVVGSRGMSGLKELFLGSVSQGVLHHARCPVLIDRGEAKPFKRILLASDGSIGAQHAAPYAFALAQRFEASITVLNVFEPSGRFATTEPNPNPVEAIEEEVDGERWYQAVKKSLQATVTKTALPYHLYQERGHPGKTIAQFAQSGQYDLIVMGSRGLGGFERMLLGSVSNYVAHHAHCPILVVR